MKLIKILNVVGREIYVNPNNVCYVSVDILKPQLISIHMNNQDFHLVKAELADIVRLLQTAGAYGSN